MKIVVLAGGTSTERDVSIVSGTKVCEALRSRGHLAILLDVFCGKEGLQAETAFAEEYDVEREAAYIRSFNDSIEKIKAERREFFGPGVLETCRAADTVFLALHGTCGEDGRIQAAFDLLGITYTGSGYLGSALAMDKTITKQLFRENGVPAPAGVIVRKTDSPKSAAELGMELPCVVKTACGGSSVGVYIVHTEEEFSEAVKNGFSYEDKLIVEQYIRGQEYTVGVIDGKAYPIVEISPIAGFYDYKNKYQAGSTIETCPAPLSAELTQKMQEIALKAYDTLRLESYARMDFMMDEDGGIYCLEANTLPGMTPTSLLPQEAAAVGMNFADLCEKLIEVSKR
ncbi:D-ala D-ala ligase N-terminal domain protein [Marvinbryantia formatexigens DSM 14469]|uniref:D-alanine--D-alanine ligase n=1 Tax=Marvinbryantia formatexigens DSM 14469 TaxID=478749 RepID=C6LJN6_9FIRM|nr:D-alanine--D-alanine ligase [Marvinbryantia formatexigens]EET59159.1 D-ala D-ala ligase N-terminal domain protein [Marvinbryantia formatexigens DSM 14469]UWO26227.1 D-alanine--D-alanine ligase [Marvinbryantia formatexigens DSM 14469]SDG11809.1 D-alanine-D-alanine ligase [Marvinbryantia formatexigens]